MPVVVVQQAADVAPALASVGLVPPRPVSVLVGGAGGVGEADLERLRPWFRDVVAPVLESQGAVAIDGGTRSGVMQLLGDVRSASGASFPLLGVAASGTVRLPGRRAAAENAADLDPGHTGFVLVPGRHWGDEAPWISLVASVLSGSASSVTLVVNGGEITYADVERSIAAGRPVLVLTGSGRTADDLAAACRGEPASERAVALAATGLVRAVPDDDPAELVGLLASAPDEATG